MIDQDYWDGDIVIEDDVWIGAEALFFPMCILAKVLLLLRISS
jgi:acetyltransferase-like isoleucine patch superfamily enzyme